MYKKMVSLNFLVPNHKKLSENDVNSLLEKYSIEKKNLPKINIKDPALVIFDLDVVEGDVIEITRKSFVGEKPYYRLVVA